MSSVSYKPYYFHPIEDDFGDPDEYNRVIASPTVADPSPSPSSDRSSATPLPATSPSPSPSPTHNGSKAILLSDESFPIAPHLLTVLEPDEEYMFDAVDISADKTTCAALDMIRQIKEARSIRVIKRVLKCYKDPEFAPWVKEIKTTLDWIKKQNGIKMKKTGEPLDPEKIQRRICGTTEEVVAQILTKLDKEQPIKYMMSPFERAALDYQQGNRGRRDSLSEEMRIVTCEDAASTL
jgi:hypothetical protein